MVISYCPNCARLCDIGGYFPNLRNCELEVLSVKAGFGDISGVSKVPVSKHERIQNRMGNIENATGDLEDMFAAYPDGEVIMFPGREMVGRAKMPNDLREIGN